MGNKFGNGIGDSKGFTLPELLVSISIFVIITTAVVANFRASEESGQLRLGAQTVASTLHSLQNMAQTGRLTALCDNPAATVCTGNPERCVADACSPRLPAGGYGIQIAQDGGVMTLFADGNENHLFDTGETLADMVLNLPRNVIIDNADDATGPYESGSLTITFEPPEPTVWINDGIVQEDAHIVLHHVKTNGTRTIILRRISGRIEIE